MDIYDHTTGPQKRVSVLPEAILKARLQSALELLQDVGTGRR